MTKPSRRKVLQTTGAAAVSALTGSVLATSASAAPQRAAAIAGSSFLNVKSIESFWISPPYKKNPANYIVPWREGHMTNTRPLCRVTLANGVVGWGEGGSPGAARNRVIGRSAAESMWDDTLGSGLQMALFDAVGRSNDVPIHRLLGPQASGPGVHELVGWRYGAAALGGRMPRGGIARVQRLQGKGAALV